MWTNLFLENNNIFSPYNDEDRLLYINLFLFKNETTTLTQQIFPIDITYIPFKQYDPAIFILL